MDMELKPGRLKFTAILADGDSQFTLTSECIILKGELPRVNGSGDLREILAQAMAQSLSPIMNGVDRKLNIMAPKEGEGNEQE